MHKGVSICEVMIVGVMHTKISSKSKTNCAHERESRLLSKHEAKWENFRIFNDVTSLTTVSTPKNHFQPPLKYYWMTLLNDEEQACSISMISWTCSDVLWSRFLFVKHYFPCEVVFFRFLPLKKLIIIYKWS